MTVFSIAGLVIMGWLLGSLVNYLADVLPETRRFTPLTCPTCGCPRSLVNAVTLRPCPHCQTQRSTRAWVVQALAVAITVLEGFYPSFALGFWPAMLLLTYFGVVALIDIEHRLILHPTSAVGAVITLGLGIKLHGPALALLGGVAGFGVMFGLYWLGALLAKGFGRMRGQAIEEEALGFGDILLCAVLGMLLGWPGIIVRVFYTIFIAGAFSLLIVVWQLVRRKYEAFTAVAFGPYLILAAIVLLYPPK